MTSEAGNTLVDVLETAAEALAKKLLHDVVIKAVIEQIVTAIPLLGSAFFNPIVTFIITKIATLVYKHAALLGGLFVIDLKEERKQKAYDEATIEFKNVMTRESTPEEIQKAKDEYKKRLADLVRIPKP